MFHEQEMLDESEKIEKPNTNNFVDLSPLSHSIKYVTKEELNKEFGINNELELVNVNDTQAKGVE